MATVLSGNKVKLNNGQVVNAQTGGWYDGQQFWNGSLSSAGQINQQSNQQGAGQQVSQQVVAQTNPNNVSYLDSQRIQANQIQAPTSMSLPSTSASQEYVTGLAAQEEQAKAARDALAAQQKATADQKVEELRAKEQSILETNIKPLVEPFREDLENAERDRLHINENFEANQQLVNELDTLLTEGNDLIRQAQEVTGLAAVRNPRIQKAMDDVASRAGVIEAVINARNGQIAVAENMIDRSINAIAADRQDQINYYQTILELNRQDILSLDETSKTLAQQQLAFKQADLENVQKTSNYIKQLLIDPATAGLMGEAGVKLTDSVDEINTKLTQAIYRREVADLSNSVTKDGGIPITDPNSVPKDELRTLTDSKGVKHYYQVKKDVSGTGVAGVGTASERKITRVKEDITNNAINFPDVVVSYANQLSLDEIYEAYQQSEMGQKWGKPKESPNEVALLYQWARGQITEAEYRAALGG